MFVIKIAAAAAAMAGDSSSTQSQPAKRRKKSSLTLIDSFGEDILREIFLRLPSLATLVRAACTCRAWRSTVASSPEFRRRFRALHPTPILGLFLEAPRPAQFTRTPSFPSFVPARRLDRELATAVRGGDFFLTSIQERLDLFPCWDIVDCCGGNVLLANYVEGLLTLFNPLLWWSKTFDLGHEDNSEGHRGFYRQLKARLLYSDEDPMSFRVVRLAHDRSRVRATVFSSDTDEWSVLPWVDVPARPTREFFWIRSGKIWIQNDCGMQANGFLYWVYENGKSIISLDTKTMEFSVAELPYCLKDRHCSFAVGEMKDGARCIVYAADYCIGVLLWGTDGNGVERWVLNRIVNLFVQLAEAVGDIPDELTLNVVAIMAGFVYLVTSEMYHDTQTPCLFLSFCLETKELVKLFWRTSDGGVHPYVMAWPPSLVGNYGVFALEDAP